MKNTELRIGNLINGPHNEVKTPHIVESITNKEIDYYPINYYTPIPLTEEWLVKFGFEQKTGIMCYVKEDYADIEIVYETIGDFYRLYPRTNKIEYVHQLQNIYFALTNTELTIK